MSEFELLVSGEILDDDAYISEICFFSYGISINFSTVNIAISTVPSDSFSSCLSLSK